MSSGTELIFKILFLVPVILLSLSLHELSHAYISYRLGDPTAKNMGRLSLNPLKHLDILGTIMILVSSLQGFGIGWAKPVPINPMYYKDRRKGTMLVSVAGPLSNILLAFIFAFPLFYIRNKYSIPSGMLLVPSFHWEVILYNLSLLFFSININLAVFNIIPVPPLDGSKILSGVLPTRQYFKLMQYENYIGLVFLLLIFVFPGILSTIMHPFTWAIETAINFIVNPIINMIL